MAAIATLELRRAMASLVSRDAGWELSYSVESIVVHQGDNRRQAASSYNQRHMCNPLVYQASSQAPANQASGALDTRAGDLLGEEGGSAAHAVAHLARAKTVAALRLEAL